MNLFPGKNEWIGIWGSHMKPEGFRSIREYQKVRNTFKQQTSWQSSIDSRCLLSLRSIIFRGHSKSAEKIACAVTCTRLKPSSARTSTTLCQSPMCFLRTTSFSRTRSRALPTKTRNGSSSQWAFENHRFRPYFAQLTSFAGLLVCQCSWARHKIGEQTGPNTQEAGMRCSKIPIQPVSDRRTQIRSENLRLRHFVRPATCLPLQRWPHEIRVSKVRTCGWIEYLLTLCLKAHCFSFQPDIPIPSKRSVTSSCTWQITASTRATKSTSRTTTRMRATGTNGGWLLLLRWS